MTADMISLTVNNKKVHVENGSTILEAAQKAGFEIPTMCNNGETEHFASCMVCVVKNSSNSALLPACSALATEGLSIVTEDKEIIEARKTAIELLMSEHVGDCEAPCRVACPANMNIPEMNRLIAEGKFDDAFNIVVKDIALPGILGRICPAPCEGACRRKQVDEAVSICLLKRFTAEEDLRHSPVVEEEKDFSVCIIGSGPAGLSAAYYNRLNGFKVDVYDCNDLPGGSLRYSIPDDVLDKSVLDKEINVIKLTGVRFIQNALIDKVKFEELKSKYNCILVATGNFNEQISDWNLANNGKQLSVNKLNYLADTDDTNSQGRVFAIGNVNRPGKLAIRSAAQGKEVAFAVKQLFEGKVISGEAKRFNSTIGRLLQDELPEYMKRASVSLRLDNETIRKNGFSRNEAMAEAARCMDCDCCKAENCILRLHSDNLKISKRRFYQTERVRVQRNIGANHVVYEPGKCIKCGICVRLTAKYSEDFGFTFIGRGFDVRIGVPFDENIDKALQKTAEIVAEACPTGALSALKRKK